MQIIKKQLLSSAHGTHKYYVEWLGIYTDKELINAVDGSTGNYGGYVKLELVDCVRKKYRGTVEVYYD